MISGIRFLMNYNRAGAVIPPQKGKVMELVGKTLKSKINGALFVVDGEFEDGGRKHYSVLDMASGKHIAISKAWFENGIMQNLEIVE